MKKLLIFLGALALQAQTVSLSDTLTNAVGGGSFTGRITVTLNAPGSASPLYYSTTSLTGWQAVYCLGVTGSDCTTTTAAGVFAATLYANSTITPAGTSYSARFTPSKGSPWTETWVVTPSTTTLRQVRSTTVPTPTTTFQASQIVPGANGQVITTTAGATAWGSVPACATCVVTSGSYADPAWITSLAGSKIGGNISGSAGSLSTTFATGRVLYGNGTGLPGSNSSFLYSPSTSTAPATISVLPTSIGREDHFFGRYYLRNWQATLAKFSSGNASSSTPVSVVVLGDSWVAGSTVTQPLRLYLQSQFGDGGPGWCPAGNYDGTPFGVSLTTTGTWTDTNSSSASGIDGYDSYSTDTATPAKKDWYGVAQRGVLYYVVQPGGGSFRYRVDSGSWTTVTTAGTLALGSATVSGLSNGYHTFTVELVSAGSSNVKILGWNLTNETQGIVIHRVGHSGATASFYETLSSGALWDDQLTALNPVTVLISLAVNDMNAAVSPASYLASMKALAEKVRATMPSADIAFYTQGDSGLTQSPYTLAEYHYPLEDYARVSSFGFIDSYKQLGAYGTNAFGFWAGNYHPTATGGAAMAHAITGYLFSGLSFNFGNKVIGDTFGTADPGWRLDVAGYSRNGTARIYNQASTGPTFLKLQESSAQSTSELFGVYSNDETVSRFSIRNGNTTLGGDGTDTGYMLGVFRNGSSGTAQFYNAVSGGATRVYIREGGTQGTTLPFGVYRNNGTSCAICVTSAGLSVGTSSVYAGYALGINGNAYLNDLVFGDWWVARQGATAGLGLGSGHRITWSAGSTNTSAGPSGDSAIARFGVGKVSIDSGTAIGTTPGNARDLINRRTYIAETTSDPSAADLTIAGSNAQDVAAIYTKNDKLVIAFNRSGTVTYLTIPLDGTTATWTQGTTAP